MSVLTHTARDVRTWDRVLAGRPSVRALIAQAQRIEPEAPDVARDLFWVFAQIEPALASDADGRHADLLRQVLTHPLYPTVRCEIGDWTLHAACAALTVFPIWSRSSGDNRALAITQGLQQALDDIEAEKRAQKAFWDTRQPMSLDDGLKLAEAAKASPKLANIAKIAGRLKNVAMRVHQTRTPDKREDVQDITLGRTLPQVLPVELAALGLPLTSAQFYQKFSENRLQQRNLDGTEQTGQGPIVVALDSSFSMTAPTTMGVSREEWAKGVLLALAEVARIEKRDLAVLHFGTRYHLHSWHFPKGQATMDDLLACIEFFYGSMGTEFDGWIHEALRLVDTSAYNKADVIVLSDGGAHVSEETQAAWDERRKERGMRCYGVMIGMTDPGGLIHVCDRIMSLNGADDEDQITSAVFSI